MIAAQFNNKLGHRSLSHKNLLAIPSGPVFVEFTGQTIPGICRVIRSDYSKNGKWSHSTWDCELADGVLSAVHSQDWDTGRYINSETWAGAVSEFLRMFPDMAGPEYAAATERFLRVEYGQTAARLDGEAAKALEAAPIAELVAAQERLAVEQKAAAATKSEVGQLIAAREAKEKAAELSRKTAAVIEKMHSARSMSLADLQELYRQL